MAEAFNGQSILSRNNASVPQNSYSPHVPSYNMTPSFPSGMTQPLSVQQDSVQNMPPLSPQSKIPSNENSGNQFANESRFAMGMPMYGVAPFMNYYNDLKVGKPQYGISTLENSNTSKDLEKYSAPPEPNELMQFGRVLEEQQLAMHRAQLVVQYQQIDRLIQLNNMFQLSQMQQQQSQQMMQHFTSGHHPDIGRSETSFETQQITTIRMIDEIGEYIKHMDEKSPLYSHYCQVIQQLADVLADSYEYRCNRLTMQNPNMLEPKTTISTGFMTEDSNIYGDEPPVVATQHFEQAIEPTGVPPVVQPIIADPSPKKVVGSLVESSIEPAIELAVEEPSTESTKELGSIFEITKSTMESTKDMGPLIESLIEPEMEASESVEKPAAVVVAAVEKVESPLTMPIETTAVIETKEDESAAMDKAVKPSSMTTNLVAESVLALRSEASDKPSMEAQTPYNQTPHLSSAGFKRSVPIPVEFPGRTDPEKHSNWVHNKRIFDEVEHGETPVNENDCKKTRTAENNVQPTQRQLESIGNEQARPGKVSSEPTIVPVKRDHATYFDKPQILIPEYELNASSSDTHSGTLSKTTSNSKGGSSRTNIPARVVLDEKGSHIEVYPIIQPDGRYKCSLCDRTFKYAKHVRRHSSSHSQYRNFQCSRCEMPFNRHDSLLRHYTRCGFRNKDEMRLHVRLRQFSQKIVRPSLDGPPIVEKAPSRGQPVGVVNSKNIRIMEAEEEPGVETRIQGREQPFNLETSNSATRGWPINENISFMSNNIDDRLPEPPAVYFNGPTASPKIVTKASQSR